MTHKNLLFTQYEAHFVRIDEISFPQNVSNIVAQFLKSWSDKSNNFGHLQNPGGTK